MFNTSGSPRNAAKGMDQSQKSFSKNLREMWYEKHENFTTAAENRWIEGVFYP